MKAIDEIYTRWPFYGSRRMTKQLQREGFGVNRKRVKRLMRVMGIEAIYPKPNLSLNGQPHPVFPYLLKGLDINGPNQVWGIDITYIRLAGGFVYLVAIIDWYSRFVVDFEVSISLDKEFVISCLGRAFLKAQPEILNSDQGVQMTSAEYIELMEENGVKISMDHRGRCFDNIFTERLWRSVKYEEVYLKEYSSPKDAALNLREYFEFYNYQRLHQALNYLTPAEVYYGLTQSRKEAKKTQSLAVLVS
jgi:putative transposase